MSQSLKDILAQEKQSLLKKSDKFKNKKQIYLTYSNYLGTRAKCGLMLRIH